MSNRFRVSEAAGLLSFLTTHVQGWSRTKLKKRLRMGGVVVNGKPTTKHDHALEAGDDVEVLAPGQFVRRGVAQLEVLYSDPDLIAINKPAGLLSVGTDKEAEHHALAMLRDQLSPPGRAAKLWPLHRLDRDTSGVLLFATSCEMRNAVAARWTEAEKIYLAVVERCPDPSEGTIDQPLRMDSRGFRAHVGLHPEAKSAITHFETKRSVRDRALLKLRPETGRQHQLRAHLAWLGHPVVGDSRYGTGGPRLGLHALRLSIMLPETDKRLTFLTRAPGDLLALLGRGP
jgi:23S rRNA pseudouridine1911/1915/1917 synthase